MKLGVTPIVIPTHAPLTNIDKKSNIKSYKTIVHEKNFNSLNI